MAGTKKGRIYVPFSRKSYKGKYGIIKDKYGTYFEFLHSELPGSMQNEKDLFVEFEAPEPKLEKLGGKDLGEYPVVKVIGKAKKQTW